MYLVIVALTMFILSIGSLWLEATSRADSDLVWFIGKWFVF